MFLLITIRNQFAYIFQHTFMTSTQHSNSALSKPALIPYTYLYTPC